MLYFDVVYHIAKLQHSIVFTNKKRYYIAVLYFINDIIMSYCNQKSYICIHDYKNYKLWN